MTFIKGSTVVELVESIRDAIERGQVPPGEPLPSVRALASQLDVHRNTVANAYAKLAGMGLIDTQRGRAGTRVALRDVFRSPRPNDPDFGPGVRNLAFGNPDPALLPDLTPHFLRAVEGRRRLYGEATDLPELIASQRDRAAETNLPKGEVVITAGAADAIERVLLAHLSPGDSVAIEEPCYTRTLLLVRALGLKPIPVEMDQEGIEPSALDFALARGARAVILTPTAQNPTGATLTAARVGALATVLAQYPNVLLIEDDHFGALTRAVPRSILETNFAPRAHWAIARSVSKFLGPDLRLAFLHTDAVTGARVQARMAVGAQWVSHVLQRTVHSALQDGVVIQSIARASVVYANRRQALLSALTSKGIAAVGIEGLHVWLPTKHHTRLAQFLLARGWAVQTGENFRVERSLGVRITTSTLEPEASVQLASEIAAAYMPRARTAGS